MKTIYIDDGHGLDTPGKRTPVFPAGHPYEGIQIKENQFNATVADKLKARAEAAGLRVIMTAPEVSDTALGLRVQRANEDMYAMGLDLEDCALVSIHYNAYDGRWDSTRGGLEVYHWPGSRLGESLARSVHDKLIQGTAQVDRGVKGGRFYVLRETAMPAILVECGFMDVRKEAERMLDPQFQDEVVGELLAGILDHFGIEPRSECQELRERVEILELEVSALRARLDRIATIAKGE